MKDEYDFILRIIMSIIPYPFLTALLLPLTIYGSKLILFFYSPILRGNTLAISGIQFEFVEACVASLAYFLLWVLVWWTREIQLKIRLKIVFLGFLLIYIANLLRILVLTIIAVSYSFNLFTKLHLLVWNILSGIFVAVIWIILTRKYRIKSIPIYDDIKHFLKKSIFSAGR